VQLRIVYRSGKVTAKASAQRSSFRASAIFVLAVGSLPDMPRSIFWMTFATQNYRWLRTH
jgi:hypothetical protein